MSEIPVETTKVRNKGQFKKGNPGGPGNPHARQVARIRATLLAALDPETLIQIVSQLIERAIRGNLEAIKILLAYSVGRPGKSDDLVELLTEHYPLMVTEGAESDVITPTADSQEAHRHQTPQTAETDRHQTAQTAEMDRHQTVQTVETDRQQTPQTVETDRHQTSQTAETDRHQTVQTAEIRQQTLQTAELRRQQTALSARMLTSVLLGRQQTEQTASDPLELMSLIQEVLESTDAPFPLEPPSEISLVR